MTHHVLSASPNSPLLTRGSNQWEFAASSWCGAQALPGQPLTSLSSLSWLIPFNCWQLHGSVKKHTPGTRLSASLLSVCSFSCLVFMFVLWVKYLLFAVALFWPSFYRPSFFLSQRKPLAEIEASQTSKLLEVIIRTCCREGVINRLFSGFWSTLDKSLPDSSSFVNGSSEHLQNKL